MIGLTVRLLHNQEPGAFLPLIQQAKAAGADTICLIPHWYTLLDGIAVQYPPWSPHSLIWPETLQMAGGVGNTAALANVYEIGKAVKGQGLALIVKPHLDCGWINGGRYGVGGWRYYLSVKDIYHTPPQWDRSIGWGPAYRAFLGPWVTLCKRLGAGLVMGCELGSVTKELGAEFWGDLAMWVRGRGHKGLLTYASNWLGEVEFLDPLWQNSAISHVAVDWYSSPEQWDARATAIIAQAVAAHKPLCLTEAGCANYVGATSNPGADPPPNATQDDTEQVTYWQHVNGTFAGADRLVWESAVVGLPPRTISHEVLGRACEAAALRPGA